MQLLFTQEDFLIVFTQWKQLDAELGIGVPGVAEVA